MSTIELTHKATSTVQRVHTSSKISPVTNDKYICRILVVLFEKNAKETIATQPMSFLYLCKTYDNIAESEQ